MKLKLVLLGLIGGIILGISKQSYYSTKNAEVTIDDAPNFNPNTRGALAQQELYMATPEHEFIIRQENLIDAYLRESDGCDSYNESSYETEEVVKQMYRMRCTQV